jgi:SAM-dependent methyltransferase
MGYRDLTAFDFAAGPLDQARHLAVERDAAAIRFLLADATELPSSLLTPDGAKLAVSFSGALFLFNGLMQIPGRDRRRAALRGLRAVCAPGAPLLFTTHDRDHSPTERALWRLEALRWERGEQDPRLVEFGDRYFEDEAGRTFMHLPDRAEILADLAATGWSPEFDALRREVATESRAVREFSDECRFWLVRNGCSPRGV